MQLDDKQTPSTEALLSLRMNVYPESLYHCLIITLSSPFTVHSLLRFMSTILKNFILVIQIAVRSVAAGEHVFLSIIHS